MSTIYSVRRHLAAHHHPSCPARDRSGPCVGCGTLAPSVPAPRPASSLAIVGVVMPGLVDAAARAEAERAARFHSWGVTR